MLNQENNKKKEKEKKKREKKRKTKNLARRDIFIFPSAFESSALVLFSVIACQIIHYLSSFSSSSSFCFTCLR